MDMIQWLQSWLSSDDSKVIYLLILIMCANLIDFCIGWLNARFNKDVEFSSSKAIYGIARKMVMFMVCVLFIPVALLVPSPFGISSLYILFTGYLISEIHSILHHLGVVKDDKQTALFSTFIGRLFGNVSFQSPIQITKTDVTTSEKPPEQNVPITNQEQYNKTIGQ